MKNEKLLLFILATIQFTHVVDFMIIMPLGATFMKIFDITPGQFSLIVSSYAISAFFMGLVSAMFIDRFDRKTALLLFYAGFIIGTFACSIAPDYYFFLLARSATGMFGGILAALVFSIVGDVIPYERRASALGWVMTAFSVASIVGVPAGIYLAAEFGWRMPFVIIGVLSLGFFLLSIYVVPSMKGHLVKGATKGNPLDAFIQIWNDPNQVRALSFSVILILGHFTIIPFIAPYMELNIGFTKYDVTYIYMIGGVCTAVLLPLVGQIADRYGNARVFTISSIFALVSIYAITNLPAVSMIVALCATSSFFIVASGRSVPATTMVTSVVKPENRGSFMSVRSSVNELGLGVSSFIAGLIIIEMPDGSLGNYEYVGYIAIVMSIVAIIVAQKLRVVA